MGYSWPGVFLPGASGRTGRFSPCCCSTTPFQLACNLVLWSFMLLGLYITFLSYVRYVLVFSRIKRALGLKRTAPKVCVLSLFWGMVMYDNEFETKEKKLKPRIKLNQNIYAVACPH